MHIVKKVAYVLVLIGALNWGLVGFFDFDLVTSVLGNMTFLTRSVYGLVGLSGLLLIFMYKTTCECTCDCKTCSTVPKE